MEMEKCFSLLLSKFKTKHLKGCLKSFVYTILIAILNSRIPREKLFLFDVIYIVSDTLTEIILKHK